MRSTMLSWFTIWMLWYIVMLPAAVYSETEIIEDGNMTFWLKQHSNLGGRGVVWNKNGKTCGTGEYAEFWFITPRVNLETTFAEVIYVDIEAELNTQCFNEGLRSYFPCYSNKFEVYAYHGKDQISEGNILNIFPQSLYNITNNTNLAKANLTRSTQTTFFFPQNNSGVTFAVRSRGACGKIFRIKMYYHVCKEKIIKTIKFERTLSPAKGFKNITANCSENSIPSQNAASFKGYCYPNGSWRIPLDDNMECLCVEGYTLNKKDGSCSSCSNTSYKTGISNDDCTECPMNTVSSDVKRASCVCKDGYYKISSDKSEVSPCYVPALPEIREKPRTRLIAYGVELSWTAPKNNLNEIILYNVTCFICSQRICNIPCQNETYDPGWNNLRQTLVTVSNLIAGEKYVFRVYVSVKDVVPEGEWRYIETDRVQVTSDSVKETTDCTDDSGIIINIIIATTVAGVFLSIIIVLLVKYKRLKRALRLLTHVDIPLKAVNTRQESLPIDQEGPGYTETVSTVVREFHDDVDTNANNSEDTSADGHYEEVGVPSVGVHKKLGYKTPGQIEAYEEPKMSQENPGYTELDKNRLQGRNADDSTYQKLQRQDSDVTPAHERRESNEDIKMGRNLPGYEELDQNKREADDYTPLTKSEQKPELA